MRKIKFKTEYVPLSDDAINRHKNFDQLLTTYAALPKPNWLHRLMHNKWTMFGGGLMTGAIVASLFWFNESSLKKVQLSSKESLIVPQASSKADRENEIKDTVHLSDDARIAPISPAQPYNSNTEKHTDEFPRTITPYSENSKKTVTSYHGDGNVALSINGDNLVKEAAIDSSFLQSTGYNTFEPLPETFVEHHNITDTISTFLSDAPASLIILENSKMVSEPENDLALVETPLTPADTILDFIISNSGNKSSEIFNEEHVVPTVAKKVEKEKRVKKDNDEEKISRKDSPSSPFLVMNDLFGKDSRGRDSIKAERRNVFSFLIDSTREKNKEIRATSDSMYVPRYGQVSFVTPLSSNGMDGSKYMHYISLNILQGYNGALKGVEFGGLLNGNKGYVTGAQFAGLGNYAGGNLRGAQFAGLANFSKSVLGAQLAGIANVSGGSVSGWQTAGVINVSADSLNGVQTVGVINVISSARKSKVWQLAGVGNVSLAQQTGAQISGVFNIANRLKGGQVGLINVVENIKGFQIGLINIADSISGVPIGLISVSGNGVFDINLWTSDFLSFNGAIRVGSQYVYNIYAYGVSPFDPDLPFGFGIGMGGHIPFKKAFIDIDGMAWTMHRSYLSFNGVNMIAQLRVMGGFKFNKYLSIFAGPALNIGVQENRYAAFNNYAFYEYAGANTTVNIWPGFIAGIRLF